MVLQSLLVKDYKKTTIATLIRFVVILSNFYIFQELSGWKQEVTVFGLQSTATEGLTIHYLLNSGALILATYLTLKSLSFGRPDIDSFNETIYLPAQDRRISFFLCAFCLFKYLYQLFDKRFLKEKASPLAADLEQLALRNTRNLILLASSCISALSAAFFKYEMSNAEKEMVMKINYFLGIISKCAICLILGVLTFYQSNGLVSLIFLFVIIIDIFRALKKIYIQNNDKMKIKDYLQLIKWMAFFVAASLALFRPLLLYSKSKDNPEKTSTQGIVRGFFGVKIAAEERLEVQELTELMMTVFSLILFSCMLELIDKLEQGASFEIFDIHMTETLEFDPKHEYYKQQQPIEDFDEVHPASMVIHYFVSKVFLILQISDDSILTRYLNFRQGFINSLANDSANIAMALNNFRMTLIKTMNKKTQYFAKLVLFVKLVSPRNAALPHDRPAAAHPPRGHPEALHQLLLRLQLPLLPAHPQVLLRPPLLPPRLERPLHGLQEPEGDDGRHHRPHLPLLLHRLRPDLRHPLPRRAQPAPSSPQRHRHRRPAHLRHLLRPHPPRLLLPRLPHPHC
jgi:hypothetical protein